MNLVDAVREMKARENVMALRFVIESKRLQTLCCAILLVKPFTFEEAEIESVERVWESVATDYEKLAYILRASCEDVESDVLYLRTLGLVYPDNTISERLSDFMKKLLEGIALYDNGEGSDRHY